jgi:hypothetical protein
MVNRFRIDGAHDSNRTPAERLVETHPCLDVHALCRAGLLVEGTEGTLQTADGGCFRSVRTLGNFEIDGQAIPVRPHPSLPLMCFGCRCGTDRYRMHLVNGVWACRDCHRLKYRSQCRGRSIPALTRIVYLRRRMSADLAPFSPLPVKPINAKRHWKLVREIRALEERLLEHATGDVCAVLERRYERHGRP